MFNIYPPFLTAMLTDGSICVGAVMVKYWVVCNCNNSWVNSGAGNSLLWVSLKILSPGVLQPHTDSGWNLGFCTRKWQRSHCLLHYGQDFTNWVFEVVIPLKADYCGVALADPWLSYCKLFPPSWWIGSSTSCQALIRGPDWEMLFQGARSSITAGVKLKVVGLVSTYKPD